MPTPTIPAGNLYMNATTYSGTGAAANVANGVAGKSFQPDFAWIKARNDTSWNQLFDSVRGVNKGLYSNDTYQETTQTDAFNSFNSNGMGLGADAAGGSVNKSGNTYVGWQWKAGGTAVSNTSGSITSSVSANTTSGFSIVTYTGTGSNATVGHGLGVTPSMIIVKQRNSSVENWLTYHASLSSPTASFMYLNGTNAIQSASNYWNGGPSSSNFGIGGYSGINAGSGTYVAYCFAPIAGYSQFGSYTGNGSTDGPFIYTGFRPRFVMFKRTDASGSWHTFDSSINSYNAATQNLYPNGSNAETANNTQDLLSNGFKCRSTDTDTNASGGTYIYAAFAENPFKYANAR